ncbi:hypothetical protein ACQ86E_31905 [Bradyrhizobium betae]|uniref:hypothetical protein n=1 Tax=Bradyrhizobium betae TaxID=244734 RepID=UPI003D66DF7C
MIRSVQFEKIGDTPTLPGFSLAVSGVTGDRSRLFLFVEESGRQAVFESDHGGIGSFPRARMDGPKRFRLLRESNGSVQTIDLPPLDLAFPKVDMFPDGRLLLAATRCNWRAETDYDLNGIIFDPHTGQANRILLGDGISDLQIDDRGRIWIAYFDEGVFGNYGWGHPGPAPVGQAGLLCFSAIGDKIWAFPNDAGPAIYDCYALNVTGAEAAIVSYPDFPICRIDAEFQLTSKRTKLRGCHAFAMSEAEILFSGQYDDPPDVAYIGRLDREGMILVGRARLLMPNGSARPHGRLQGRGKHLYHFGEDGVYRATVS